MLDTGVVGPKANIERVSIKFLALKIAIKNELERPTDGRKAVSVLEAIDKIINTPTADREAHEEAILKEDMQSILDFLGLDWGYLNPEIYATIISEFSLHGVKEQLAEYQKELGHFMKVTPIKEFSEVVGDKELKSPETFVSLVTQHKWKTPVHLSDLEAFRCEVASEYNLWSICSTISIIHSYHEVENAWK